MNTKEIIKKNHENLEKKFSEFQKSLSNLEKEINKENVLEKINEMCEITSNYIRSL